MDNQLEKQTAKQNIIHFDEGIPGFEEIKDYLLYHEDDDGIIWNLQAAHSEIPSFVVIDPYPIVSNYSPELTPDDLRYFNETDAKNLCVLVVAVIKPDLKDSVINLKAPIIINVNSKKARQIILENSDFPIRYKLFQEKE